MNIKVYTKLTIQMKMMITMYLKYEILDKVKGKITTNHGQNKEQERTQFKTKLGQMKDKIRENIEERINGGKDQIRDKFVLRITCFVFNMTWNCP